MISKILDLIKSNFEQYEAEYVEPPSYIKLLSGNERKIILIYKKGIISDLITINNHNIYTKNVSDLDMTGSPLKDDCDLDSIKNDLVWCTVTNGNRNLNFEEKYQQIKTSDARKIITILNFTKFDNIEAIENVCIWIICDDKESPLLEITLKKSSNSRGIVKYQNFKSYEEITPLSLFNTHFSAIKDTAAVVCNIESEFNIQSNVKLTIKHVKSNQQNLFKSGNNVDIILKQSVNLNSENDLIVDFWKELVLLNSMHLEIEKDSNLDDSEEYNTDDELDVETLKKNLTYILSGDICTSLDIDEISSNPQNIDIEKTVVKVLNRKSYNISDNIWIFLKDYSFKNFKQILSILFLCAAKIIVEIPVTTNRLTELILDVSKQRISIPCLTEIEALKLILEIGIEKLINDYELIFTETNICSTSTLNLNHLDDDEEGFVEENLQSNSNKNRFTMRKSLFVYEAKKSKAKPIYIGFQNTYYKKKEINKKLAKLGQLHLTLEHIMLAQRNFNQKSVNVAIFKEISQKPCIPLNKLLNADQNYLDMLLLDNTTILSQLVDCKPDARRVSMHSCKNGIDITNVFYHSLEPIFAFYKTTEADEAKQRLEGKQYFCVHYLNINSSKI